MSVLMSTLQLQQSSSATSESRAREHHHYHLFVRYLQKIAKDRNSHQSVLAYHGNLLGKATVITISIVTLTSKLVTCHMSWFDTEDLGLLHPREWFILGINLSVPSIRPIMEKPKRAFSRNSGSGQFLVRTARICGPEIKSHVSPTSALLTRSETDYR